MNPRDKARSRVIVTAKNGGLRVYDLRGRETQSFATPPAPDPDDEPGRFNNVELVSTPLPGFPGGLLVVHDGQDTPDGGGTATNMKFLDAGFLRS